MRCGERAHPLAFVTLPFLVTVPSTFWPLECGDVRGGSRARSYGPFVAVGVETASEGGAGPSPMAQERDAGVGNLLSGTSGMRGLSVASIGCILFQSRKDGKPPPLQMKIHCT